MESISEQYKMHQADILSYPKYFCNTNYFDVLEKEIDFKEGFIKLFGKTVKIPRLQSLYVFNQNTHAYKYSGANLLPTIYECKILEMVKAEVEQLSNQTYNTALINLYRNGTDGVGWHSDDESLLTDTICSVSFGETRKFQIRNKQAIENKINIHLHDGDVLLMQGNTQEYWQHTIPKEPKINITFRNVNPK
jgi:alkylated DNA repair dioxygenase AlkB